MDGVIVPDRFSRTGYGLPQGGMYRIDCDIAQEACYCLDAPVMIATGSTAGTYTPWLPPFKPVICHCDLRADEVAECMP